MEWDKSKIHYYQKNRGQFLMIDYVTDIKVCSYAKGFKKLDKELWFFKIHWPGDPNMPGMLQVEAMVQMSSLIILTMPKMSGGTLYLADSNNIKFFTKIIPGDKLKIISKLISNKRGLYKFESEGYVKRKIACKASFTLILPGSVYISPDK